MDTICRLCAKEKPSKQLGRCIDDYTLNLQQKLIDCCRWNSLASIENYTLPKRICNTCYRKLEASWSFAESVAQAQQEINALFGGEEKPALPQIEHVNIAIVKDEPDESYDVFGGNEPIIDTIDTNATATFNDIISVEPTAKLEMLLNQIDNNPTIDHHFNDDDDEVSLASIEHDVFGSAAASSTEAAAPSSTESQSFNSTIKTKSSKKKPTAKNIDVAKVRKESQKLPRSFSCICDTCGKELSHADGLKLHLKIHSNKLNYECKTCGKRFLRRDNLKVNFSTNHSELNWNFD